MNHPNPPFFGFNPYDVNSSKDAYKDPYGDYDPLRRAARGYSNPPFAQAPLPTFAAPPKPGFWEDVGNFFGKGFNYAGKGLKTAGNALKPYSPKDLGQLATLASAGVNAFSAFNVAKNQKEALKIARENYERQVEKEEEEKAKEKQLADYLKNVWSRH